MLIQETRMTVPAGKTGDRPIEIDLANILIAEQRQNEVAMVTPMKAPELLSLFNGTWRDVDRLVTQLTAEKIAAERELERRTARLLLDEIPAILEAKKVKDSKDTRDAAIALDEKVITITDRVDQLTAAVAYFKGKLKSFENAFTSVKKIMGEDTYNMQGRMGNKNLSGGAKPEPLRDTAPVQDAPITPTPQEQQTQTTAKSTPGWGHPRYGKGS